MQTQEGLKDSEPGREEPKTIDELHWNWIEGGIVVRQQLAKAVIHNRNNSILIAYMFRLLDRQKGLYRDPRMALVRYYRRNGVIRRRGQGFNLRPVECYVLEDIFRRWLGMESKSDDAAETSVVPGIDLADRTPAQSDLPDTQYQRKL